MPSPSQMMMQSTLSPDQSHHSGSYTGESPGKYRAITDGISPQKPVQRTHTSGGKHGLGESQNRLPSISRKVKACAACRKQKIKCIMTGEPPCQRCKERGLSCRLNKSLQTLMSEDSRWKSAVTKDVSAIYAHLEGVLSTLSLPQMPALQSTAQDPAVFFDQDETNNDQDDDDDPSNDNSPKVSPVTENLSHVPIESLYQITGLRSLRATEGVTEDQIRICKQLRDSDFISRGLMQKEDAEYLADFYLKTLDAYVWHLAGEYKDLEAFRRRSPTLTACILTVAALHDTTRPHVYPICCKEYRRLVANAMFERKIDMEYLRALVIGSYWLSDLSWTLSGYAIRRSSEFHLRICYHQIAESHKDPTKYTKEQLQNAIDGLRVLYMLHVCDHNLSILYGRSSIMRDNESYINDLNAYITCSVANDSDKRIASQVSLSSLMNKIRESLGPEDTNSILPASAVPTIHQYERDLDSWVSNFSQHNPSRYVGNWPTKGVIMHYHFAKLYLDSYVLRGLPDINAVIPEHFLETAAAAISAATSIINMLLEDKDLQAALARVPHYFHGMIAFACMFLLKVATKHSEQLFVDLVRFRMLIAGLAGQLKVTVVGKEHLIHRMAEGLEKMAEMLGEKSRKILKERHEESDGMFVQQQVQVQTNGNGDGQEGGQLNFDGLDGTGFDFGETNIGLGMPFFDFEGANMGAGEGIYSFTS
jgi:Fungal Zn(2)-Cys(6) binuclear cluster domain